MFSAHRQIFLWLLILPAAACRSNVSTENAVQNVIAPPIIKTAIPFSNREPEMFQTEIVITSSAANAKSERRYFLARNGAKRLLIFNRGAKKRNGDSANRHGKLSARLRGENGAAVIKRGFRRGRFDGFFDDRISQSKIGRGV